VSSTGKTSNGRPVTASYPQAQPDMQNPQTPCSEALKDITGNQKKRPFCDS